MNQPGTYTIVSSDNTGTVSMTLNYDPATGLLRDVGAPAAALLVVNNTSQAWPCIITTADGQFSQLIPRGTTRATAAQIQAQAGITNVSQVQVSL
jgi:hypothetical protein